MFFLERRVTVGSLDEFPPTEPISPLLSWNATGFLGGKCSGIVYLYILYYFQKQVDQIFLVLSAFYGKNKFAKLKREKLHFLWLSLFEKQCRIQVRQNHSEEVCECLTHLFCLSSHSPLHRRLCSIVSKNFLFPNVLAVCFFSNFIAVYFSWL